MPRSARSVALLPGAGRLRLTVRRRGSEHPCSENNSDSTTFSGTISLKSQQTSSERGELAGELNLVILLSCDRGLDRILSPDCQRPYKGRLSQRETIPQMATKGWGKPNPCLTLGKVTEGQRHLAGRKKFLLSQHTRLHSDLLFVCSSIRRLGYSKPNITAYLGTTG